MKQNTKSFESFLSLKISEIWNVMEILQRFLTEIDKKKKRWIKF